jgi:hypothetical protein
MAVEEAGGTAASSRPARSGADDGPDQAGPSRTGRCRRCPAQGEDDRADQRPARPNPATTPWAVVLGGPPRALPPREVPGPARDLGNWVAAVAAKGLQKGSRPSLAQRDTVLGEICRRAGPAAVGWLLQYLRIVLLIWRGRSFDLKIITVMRSGWEQTARRPRITRRWWAPPGTQDEENQQL